jgi:TRAP-type C4-dicarboxylate transport system permease small subunit
MTTPTPRREPPPPPSRRAIAPAAEAALGRVIGWIAQALAILGGAVLTAVVVVSVVSIIGRAGVGTDLPLVGRMRPIPGDYEIVELGVGFAVFSFLAWCQYKRGHVTVDIFVSQLGPRGLAWLATFTNLIMTGIAGLLAYQHYLGMLDRQRFGETTTILQLPLWWGYAGGLLGASLFAIVSFYTVWRSLNEALGAGEPDGFAA